MYYAQRIAKQGWVMEMEHAGFKAQLMMAERLSDSDRSYGLPPGDPIPVFPIATLPGAPKEWVREAGTYVCPVDVEKGLWFDWTHNDQLNTAVIPSVKGMNPITGQKIENLRLEQYADKCPVHDKPFAHGRLCEECGYEWPPQNYVCAPNTLWWDGWRQSDGTVRQFFFTDEEKRDIASLIIGKENTVPAFGFAFYRPKNPRSYPRQVMRGSGFGGQSLMGSKTCNAISVYSQKISDKSWQPQESSGSPSYDKTAGMASGGVQCNLGAGLNDQNQDTLDHYGDDVVGESLFALDELPEPTPRKTKDVAVGAGAKIDQVLEDDSLGLDGWQEKETAAIRLYFCFEKQFAQIVKKGGVKELASNPAGYLDKLPIG